jgi:hypothetical protein
VNGTRLGEEAIAVALVIVIIALTIIVIVSGASSIPATGLRDVALALVGALAGTKIPRP